MVLLLRFESGDVLPEYSTLRADPMGTKAFYESLENLGLPVERNYRTMSQLTDVDRTTVPDPELARLYGRQASRQRRLYESTRTIMHEVAHEA